MTTITIDGEHWLIDGTPTHAGRTIEGVALDGLLLNSRMANGMFDDANPYTRSLWAYPDTGVWDAQRNTDELIAMLPTYRSCGLDAICVNLQGGSPLGYYRSDAANIEALLTRIRRDHPSANEDVVWSDGLSVTSQPWDSGAIERSGDLRPAYMARAKQLIRACDDHGLAVVLGIFYFGQDERLQDEVAVRRAVTKTCEWVLEERFKNVIIEINNECNVPRYEHAILTPPRVHELITLACSVTDAGGDRLAVGTSYAIGALPSEAVVAASDFILLHGNSMDDPRQIGDTADAVRAIAGYRPMPVLFNEDDHFDFDKPVNNFYTALKKRCGWGFFDPGEGAGGSMAFGDYKDGYQNPPVNWGLNTDRKRAFFDCVSRLTGNGTSV